MIDLLDQQNLHLSCGVVAFGHDDEPARTIECQGVSGRLTVTILGKEQQHSPNEHDHEVQGDFARPDMSY